MPHQDCQYWLTQAAPICEFIWGLRSDFWAEHELSTPLRQEAGSLDAPETLPAGSMMRYVMPERTCGWPRLSVCTR